MSMQQIWIVGRGGSIRRGNFAVAMSVQNCMITLAFALHGLWDERRTLARSFVICAIS